MRTRKRDSHTTGAIVTGGTSGVNNLGVVRALGRQGVPVLLLSLNYKDIVRYSRYVSQKIAYPDPKESEERYIDFLLKMGKNNDKKYVIFPSRDIEVLALSKYKNELEQYYLLPIPPYEVVQKFVNKKIFYQWLGQISAPHPKTYFAGDIDELGRIGREIAFPYIIKPAFSHLFGGAFHTKCFPINSTQELDRAIARLRDRNIDVFIQDIVPGNDLYSISMYFNNKSEPLAICGYDKRIYPPDFGVGSLARSNWREDPINESIRVLKATQYYGFAEPEFIRDPRDGQYKFMEINARTILQSALPAACGADVVYTAYLDTTGQYQGAPLAARDGVTWIDEVYDVLSCLKQMKAGKLGIKDVIRSWKGKKVSATFAWSDPLPSFFYFLSLARIGLKRVISRKR